MELKYRVCCLLRPQERLENKLKSFDNKRMLTFYLKHLKYAPEERSCNCGNITVTTFIDSILDRLKIVYRCRNGMFVSIHELCGLFVLHACIQCTSMSSNIYFTWYAGQRQSSEVQNVSLPTVKRLLWVFQPATQHKTPEDRIPHGRE